MTVVQPAMVRPARPLNVEQMLFGVAPMMMGLYAPAVLTAIDRARIRPMQQSLPNRPLYARRCIGADLRMWSYAAAEVARPRSGQFDMDAAHAAACIRAM